MQAPPSAGGGGATVVPSLGHTHCLQTYQTFTEGEAQALTIDDAPDPSGIANEVQAQRGGRVHWPWSHLLAEETVVRASTTMLTALERVTPGIRDIPKAIITRTLKRIGDCIKKGLKSALRKRRRKI